MLRNYLKVALRNFGNNKVFSIINIVGLSAGLACCILMFLFIQHELSYDKFNSQAKNIFRLTSVMQGATDMSELAVTPAPWAPLMKKDFPEIKEYTRLVKDEKVLIGQPGQQHFYETGMLYADSTFFNVFSVRLEKGDVLHALDKPNSIILTDENSKKIFWEHKPDWKNIGSKFFWKKLHGRSDSNCTNSAFHFSFQLQFCCIPANTW
jgi:putative ABC transport system permease protein